jgi:lysophospholipase L1-like esterase
MAGMKKQNFAGLFVGLCLGATPLLSHAQANFVTIMPMGDSVTARGDSPESSYRYWLYTMLQNAGFNNFDFIGNQTGVSDGAPANPDFDQDYEGGGAGGDAWNTEDGLNAAPSAASMTPNILILDLGSNDIIDGIDPSETEANLEAIIQDFAAANPSIIVLIAKPTPYIPDPSATRQGQRLEKRQQSQLAAMVGRVAKTEKRAGVNVIAVNQFGGFNARRDTKDGSHPNVRGEQKIARKYFSKLRTFLRRM